MNYLWKLVCECRNQNEDDVRNGSGETPHYGSTDHCTTDVDVRELSNLNENYCNKDKDTTENNTNQECLKDCKDIKDYSDVLNTEVATQEKSHLQSKYKEKENESIAHNAEREKRSTPKFKELNPPVKNKQKREHKMTHVSKIPSNKRRCSNSPKSPRRTVADNQGSHSPGFADKSTHFQYIITTVRVTSDLCNDVSPHSSPKRTTSYSCPKPKRHVAQVLPGLLIGSQEFARDLHGLEKHGVTHVINATVEIDNCFPEKFCYKKLYVQDLPLTNINHHFEDCYQFIQGARSGGGCVLVHCYFGASRSASIIAAFLIRNGDMRSREAIDFLQKLRPGVCPNDGFLRQLQDYETHLCKQ